MKQTKINIKNIKIWIVNFLNSNFKLKLNNSSLFFLLNAKTFLEWVLEFLIDPSNTFEDDVKRNGLFILPSWSLHTLNAFFFKWMFKMIDMISRQLN